MAGQSLWGMVLVFPPLKSALMPSLKKKGPLPGPQLLAFTGDQLPAAFQMFSTDRIGHIIQRFKWSLLAHAVAHEYGDRSAASWQRRVVCRIALFRIQSHLGSIQSCSEFGFQGRAAGNPVDRR